MALTVQGEADGRNERGFQARVVATSGRDDVALVHVAQMRGDPARRVEFVDALDPRYPRHEKWVVIVSTQFGCPVGCPMCEAGGWFIGNLTADEVLWQVDRVVLARHPDGRVPSRKLKVQLARMGEPALNPSALDALEALANRYDAPGLIPCVATVAPAASAGWFERLREIKRALYPGGRFQLQFSVNTTDEALRDRLMPVGKWRLADIARFGEVFFEPGDRKVVLNFALAEDWEVDPGRLSATFDPSRFVIKLTPLNPTSRARAAHFRSVLSASAPSACDRLAEDLGDRGFECIVSIGTDEEIAIRSNCGQAVVVGRQTGAARRL